MNTEQLIDFLKTGMGTATQVSDTLLRQFTNYLFIQAALDFIVTAMVFSFLYASIGKGIRFFADDKVSQGWAIALRALRTCLVVGSIVFSYLHLRPSIEPLVAPHIWLLKQGLEVMKNNSSGSRTEGSN